MMTTTGIDTPRRTPDTSYDDSAHRHTSRCYWDLHRCAWQCPPPDTRPPFARTYDIEEAC